MVTIALAVGVQRMAHRRAVTPAARGRDARLAAVICTDKTGTLTQNRMTVAELWGDRRALLSAAVLCSDGTGADRARPARGGGACRDRHGCGT